MPDQIDSEQELFQKIERADIAQRRAQAGLAPTAEEPPRHVAGLALSGGGIRSASFNLGLLQALYERRLLRQFDYLSTVSGGGYIGGFVAALASDEGKEPRSPLRWDAQQGTDADRVPTPPATTVDRHLLPGPTGEQPGVIKRMIRGGRYLKQTAEALNHYAIGLVTLNLIIGSTLLAAGAFAAWLFRWLDALPVRHVLSAVGFKGDVRLAMAPAVVMGLVWCGGWLALWFARLGGKRPPFLVMATRVAFFSVCALAALGFVAVLATGDIALSVGSERVAGRVNQFSHGLAATLIVLQVLALTPLFRLDRLIRSGVSPRNPAESWFFGLVSYAIVCGLPLLSFAFFVREDASRLIADNLDSQFRGELADRSVLVDHRDPWLLSAPHIKDWNEFWERVQRESTLAGAASRPNAGAEAVPADPRPRAILKPSQTVWASVQGLPAERRPGWFEPQLWDDLKLQGAPLVAQSVIVSQALKEETDSAWFYDGPFGLIAHAAGNRDNHFTRVWRLRRLSEQLQRQIVHAVNRNCLQQSSWYASFGAFHAGLQADTLPPGVQLTELLYWRDQAEGLARAADPQIVRRREQFRLNRHLLQSYYGDVLAPPRTVFAYNVLGADQQTRLRSAGVFAVIAMVCGLCFGLNSSSMHEFYRRRIRDMWVASAGTAGASPTPLKLSATGKCGGRWSGAPYLLINATANLFGPPLFDRRGTQGKPSPETAPRACRFLFSPRYCGCGLLGFRKTTEYEQRQFDLAGALAISGSAVGPVVTGNFVMGALMFIANVRLGQWLPNPLIPLTRRAGHVSLFRFLWEKAFRSPEQRSFVFLSDGGHYDNLGLEALLARRARVIICSDATCDPDRRFSDLLVVVRRSRAMQGVRICTLSDDAIDGPGLSDFGGLRGHFTQSHISVLRVQYPEPDEDRPGEFKSGYLVYLKPTFTRDESMELHGYRAENPHFPYDPTLDQFYDERRFESYRQLGHHIGLRVAKRLFEDMEGRDCPADATWLADHWEPRGPVPAAPHATDDRIESIARLLESRVEADRDAGKSEFKELLQDEPELDVPQAQRLAHALRLAMRRERDHEAKSEFADLLEQLVVTCWPDDDRGEPAAAQ